MSIPSSKTEALADALILAELGVPVFSARLKANGDPIPPNGWEKTRAVKAAAARYRPSNSTALCAVTGVVYDVLDVDPRNGGDKSIQRLSSDLGDDGPEIYWRVKTPSGGLHLYIAALGIGSHTGFLPGLDLKGGRPDGSSRGFVFLPPTVRPSKVTGKRAQYERSNGEPSDSPPIVCEALARYVNERLAAKSGNTNGAFHRNEAGSLRQACLDAEAGDQRTALLRYVHELERRGYARDDIVTVTLGLVMEMPTYDIDNPWTERDIRGLLHAKGAVTPDAFPGELDELEGPITAGLVQFSTADEIERISWLWVKHLAFRELTILDGEKAQGKSFVVDDWAAIASRGGFFPGSEVAIDPINTIIFTDEGHWESTTLPRLVAAGANLARIARPKRRKPKKRDKNDDWGLALPDGANLMERMIREAGAQFAIWDPITDFLDESINSHNDASVRRALRPLNGVLTRTNCVGLAIRHLNKNTNQEAKFRGGGSVAFANRARVHLIAARLPAGQSNGTHGIGQLDINLTKKVDKVLAYSIEDSDIDADTTGENKVGRVEWHGYIDISADDLGRTEHGRKGPAPIVQDEIINALNDMFAKQPVWDSEDARKELAKAGITANKETIVKARKRAGIISRARYVNGMINGWDWKAINKDKVSSK